LIAMLKNPRTLHRALVPFAAIPMILTTVSGIVFNVLDKRGIEAD
jgi:hypothetical protein